MEEITELLSNRLAVLSLPLKPYTGIFGTGLLMQGVLWEVLRPYAMRLTLPFDSITIDLDP